VRTYSRLYSQAAWIARSPRRKLWARSDSAACIGRSGRGMEGFQRWTQFLKAPNADV